MGNLKTEEKTYDLFYDILSEILFECKHSKEIQHKLSDDGMTVVKMFDKIDTTNRILQFELMSKIFQSEHLASAIDRYSQRILEECLNRINEEFLDCLRKSIGVNINIIKIF
jgi:hypothetical protein